MNTIFAILGSFVIFVIISEIKNRLNPRTPYVFRKETEEYESPPDRLLIATIERKKKEPTT